MSKDSTGRESGGVEQDLRKSMSESKHTPGAVRAASKIMDIIHSELGKTDTGKSPTWDLAQKDLAGIIDKETAAPELLEALKSIENDNGSIPAKIWGMRNRAIAKAKGKE